jgi:hypothetical protein
LLVALGCDLDEDGWPITHGDGLTSVAGFAIVEDCGHILTWEKPEALAQAAWPFLREHP